MPRSVPSTNPARTCRGPAAGFTLIELLIVVAILGVLAALAIPRYAEYRARGVNARVAADARLAASAQEAYYVDQLTYYNGACSGLPAYDGSPGVSCSTTGDATDYAITTSHPEATRSCTWTSTPATGQNLVCS